MRKSLVTILLWFCILPAFAGHIAGGEMYYKYLGPGASPNTDSYEITLRLFRECHPSGGPAAELPTVVRIGIFRNSTPSAFLREVDVSRTFRDVINLTRYSSCILTRPEVCYQIGYYTFRVDLDKDPYGYVCAYQTCCRSNSQVNVTKSYNSPMFGPIEGATNYCEIPGTNIMGLTETNSSAVFLLKDTALVCAQKNILLDFGATDPDLDSLTYSFCSAYDKGAADDASSVTPSNPPYNTVTYNAPYSGSSPLGSGVTINPTTGIISGKSPVSGAYVVNVCVAEWRHGRIISIHKKDFLLKITDCEFAQVDLPVKTLTCDGFTTSFENNSTSPNITAYYWDFGVTGSTLDTSSLPKPTYTYADTGVYTVKLTVFGDAGCIDSGSTELSVFPGFIPDFTTDGSCVKNAYVFKDLTSTKYGFVDSWRWNFGDLLTTADTSRLKNPSYLYPAPSTPVVSLIVTNSKGCVDTVSKTITVSAEPAITVGFADTLICKKDTLALFSSSSGTPTFSWQPAYNIINANTANPLVYPKTTTTYQLTVDDRGCISTAPVTVRVADSVYLRIGNDSTICQTDTMQLDPSTNALYYAWSPALGLSDSTVLNPGAAPLNTTRYILDASIGSCNKKDTVNIRVVPYPLSDAGLDTAVCYGKTIQLHASITGSSFTWDPVISLLNANTLTPVAGPQSTTAYTLEVYDTLGCPKPGTDTIVVRVVPPVQAFAGHDTTIVVTQPLQLNASGGDIYTWTPTVFMNNPGIFNPVITIPPGSKDLYTYNLKVVTKEGCVGYDDINVRVFETKPEIFVPTGFTPNSDGQNDVLRPTIAGMKTFLYFRVYNRLGNLLYSTSDYGQGWDGTYHDQKQGSGTYVYVAEAIDYAGNRIIRKGTAVLIR